MGKDWSWLSDKGYLLLCEECGEGILDDDWHIVPDYSTGRPITICSDCYHDGPPEPPTRAMPEREA
jgi:hypothetical protein